MDQAQLDFLVRQVFWVSVAASWVPARSAACCFLLKVWPRLSSHFLSVATALKTPASVLRFSRAWRSRLAEYDRLLVELATGQASAAGGVVGEPARHTTQQAGRGGGELGSA
jgi:hypothetical protein